MSKGNNNKGHDILNELKRLPRYKTGDDFLEQLQRKIEERKKQKHKPTVKLTGFIREHLYAATLSAAAMIAVVWFSVSYFSSGDRIDLTNQQINKIVVDLTQYRNMKVVPSVPDTVLAGLRTSVMNVQGRSGFGDRIRVSDIEKFIANAAKETEVWRRKVMEGR